jgi:hypothetical protein
MNRVGQAGGRHGVTYMFVKLTAALSVYMPRLASADRCDGMKSLSEKGSASSVCRSRAGGNPGWIERLPRTGHPRPPSCMFNGGQNV